MVVTKAAARDCCRIVQALPARAFACPSHGRTFSRPQRLTVATSLSPRPRLSAPPTSASRLLIDVCSSSPATADPRFPATVRAPLLPPDPADSSLRPASAKPSSAPARSSALLSRYSSVPSGWYRAPPPPTAAQPSMSGIRSLPKIPLSPSSPPETGLKQRTAPETTKDLPPTPEYMSVATKSYVANYHSQNMDDTPSRSSPRSSPTSSSYNNASSSNSLTQRTAQPYQTLASATAMAASAMQGPDLSDPDQHRDKRQRLDEPNAMDTEDPIRLPGHEDNALPHKEETTTPNIMDVDQQPESVRDTLDELQKDMGEPFLLRKSKLKPSPPDPSNHLLGIYGLSPLLGDVIRMDPITGEKINKLRKSYEGQIKLFGLAGKNKPDPCVRKKEPAEEAEPGPLRKAIGSSWRGLQSDQDWRTDHASSEIATDDDLRRRMRKALAIQPGTVRNPAEWDEYLGHDKTRPSLGPPPVAAAPRKVPNGVIQQPRAREPVDKRTTRGKKRSYDDDSFVGYGDGYSDVEDAGARDDDDGGAARKKRRKPSFGFQ